MNNEILKHMHSELVIPDAQPTTIDSIVSRRGMRAAGLSDVPTQTTPDVSSMTNVSIRVTAGGTEIQPAIMPKKSEIYREKIM